MLIKPFREKNGLKMFDIITATDYAITSEENGWHGIIIGAFDNDIVPFPLSACVSFFPISAKLSRVVRRNEFKPSWQLSNCVHDIPKIVNLSHRVKFEVDENKILFSVIGICNQDPYADVSTDMIAREIKKQVSAIYDKHKEIEIQEL